MFDLDSFVLRESALSRSSLDSISPPPTRLPSKCELPKNYFYCPLPIWASGCGLKQSDCYDASLDKVPPEHNYVTQNHCALDTRINIGSLYNINSGYWVCNILACSASLARNETGCAAIVGWPGARSSLAFFRFGFRLLAFVFTANADNDSSVFLHADCPTHDDLHECRTAFHAPANELQFVEFDVNPQLASLDFLKLFSTGGYDQTFTASVRALTNNVWFEWVYVLPFCSVLLSLPLRFRL